MKYLHFLKQGNYIVCNKKLAKSIGLLESIFLSSLLDIYDYREKKDLITSQGFFVATQNDIENSITLSRKQQDSCIKTLKEIGLIETKLIGIPAKRHFKFSNDFDEIIEELLSDNYDQNSQSSLTEMDDSVCPKGTDQFVQKVQTSTSEKYKHINNTNTNYQYNIINKEKINQKEKTILQENLDKLELYQTELNNSNLDQKDWIQNQKNQSQIWSEEKAKENIKQIFEIIKAWMVENPRKLKRNPNIKTRFKQFAQNNDIGWIFPSNQNNYKSKGLYGGSSYGLDPSLKNIF